MSPPFIGLVGLDEPGILVSSDFLLSWSQLQPTRLLAKIVATVHTDDVLTGADRIAVESAERDPALRDKVDSSFQMYRSAYRRLQISRAIAWKRYCGRPKTR